MAILATQDIQNHVVSYNHVLPWQNIPLPVKPLLQVQLKRPGVFVQVANELQLCVFIAHSSISPQYVLFINV